MGGFSTGRIGGFSTGRIGGSYAGRIGGARVAGLNRSGIGSPRVYSGNRWQGGNVGVRHWQGGSNWYGKNWSGKNWSKNKFHDHHRFNRRFVGIGLGWWPGYYGYSYGYGDCAWLRRQAVITGSPYWWNRYRACIGYY
jgi:hypothetical protein